MLEFTSAQFSESALDIINACHRGESDRLTHTPPHTRLCVMCVLILRA